MLVEIVGLLSKSEDGYPSESREAAVALLLGGAKDFCGEGLPCRRCRRGSRCGDAVPVRRT